jgi:hypothetical protein
MTDRKAVMLDKVRKLLAQAANTPFEAEADTFRKKADEIMTAYAIEAFEVKAGSEERVKPDKRNFEFSWYWTDQGPLSQSLYTLMWVVARHARCIIIPEYVTSGSIPVIGMPSDLDYMDMLFTDLMIQLVGQVKPKPDSSKGYYDNLKTLREAGVSWPEVADMMMAIGQEPLPGDTVKKNEHKMTRDYRAWCKKTGTEQNYNHWLTYRRNFAEGFVASIRDRLAAMRQTSQGENNSTGSTAIALRDIRQVVADAVFEFYPNYRPQKGRAVANTRKYDVNAQSAGRSAGSKARIASGASSLKSNKQLSK